MYDDNEYGYKREQDAVNSTPSGQLRQPIQSGQPVPPVQYTPYVPQYPQDTRPLQPTQPVPPAQNAPYKPQYQQYQQYPQYPQYAPQVPPTPQHSGRKRMGAGMMALLVVACMILAAAAGFAGGYIATINNPGRGADYTAQDTKQPAISPNSPSGSNAPVFEGVPPPSDSFSFSTLTNNKGQDMTVPEVAAIVKPSVVEIKTETVTSGGWTGTYVSEGAGSGVIISADGYIITNDHVITGASSITVRLVDGREFPASLIATDSRADIAVIKISASDLPPAVVGDSSALVVGEGTLAVGNPLGELGGTVTGGIISALDREMIVEGEAMTLLQTDAAVNPGNSGGGLFNMRAELIGIVNSKSSGLSIEGLGFAIPSNIAKAVASDLIEYGYVRGRVDTGLELVDIQSTQAARWYRVSQIGLYVLSSADEQLRNGDRITAVDGTAVTNLYDFNTAMKNHDIGSSVTISVARGNDTVSAVIVLKEWQP